MEGDARSDVSREQAHGHKERVPSYVKMFWRILSPFGIGQPDKDFMSEQPKRKRDPLEDTPAEALRELQAEIMGHPGSPPHRDNP